mgnify:CR=1 FL=1
MIIKTKRVAGAGCTPRFAFRSMAGRNDAAQHCHCHQIKTENLICSFFGRILFMSRGMRANLGRQRSR